MPVTADLLRTWRGPRAVMRDILAQGRREDRAIVFLMIACFLIFVAQWPRLSRIAGGYEASPWPADVNFEGMMTYSFYSLVIMVPLLMYAVAAISRILARIFGGQGSWYGARIALFWSLLAVTPLFLLHGLVRGFIGAGPEANIVGAILLGTFIFFWFQCLREAESPQ